VGARGVLVIPAWARGFGCFWSSRLPPLLQGASPFAAAAAPT